MADAVADAVRAALEVAQAADLVTRKRGHAQTWSRANVVTCKRGHVQTWSRANVGATDRATDIAPREQTQLRGATPCLERKREQSIVPQTHQCCAVHCGETPAHWRTDWERHYRWMAQQLPRRLGPPAVTRRWTWEW